MYTVYTYKCMVLANPRYVSCRAVEKRTLFASDMVIARILRTLQLRRRFCHLHQHATAWFLTCPHFKDPPT
jgi:hypothetical protein